MGIPIVLQREQRDNDRFESLKAPANFHLLKIQ